MEPTEQVQRLCESGWERLAGATKSEQFQLADRFLELLGWSEPTPMALPGMGTDVTAMSYLLRHAGGDSLAAHFVMPGTLQPPSTVVEGNLDFCDASQAFAQATGALGLQYALITDLFRTYLYDVSSEELLLWADTPADFSREFSGVLTRSDVEAGVLGELRRRPRSVLARELRKWCMKWEKAIIAETCCPEEVAAVVLDRLLALRYLHEQDLMVKGNWYLGDRLDDVIGEAFGNNPDRCGIALGALFQELCDSWNAQMFETSAELDVVLARGRVIAPMLREFALLSQVKFDSETVLESFNFGDAAEKARVRMIPEPDEERQAYLGKQTTSTIDAARVELDLEDDGYRAVLYWFDQVVAVYRRLEREFMMRHYDEEATGGEDLFEWSEKDAKRPEALADRFSYVLEQGLVIYYSSPRQARTARLLLYMHLVDQYRETGARFEGFPDVEAALQTRPQLLDSDRKQIYGAGERGIM
jgi:hypothetical protein